MSSPRADRRRARERRGRDRAARARLFRASAQTAPTSGRAANQAPPPRKGGPMGREQRAAVKAALDAACRASIDWRREPRCSGCGVETHDPISQLPRYADGCRVCWLRQRSRDRRFAASTPINYLWEFRPTGDECGSPPWVGVYGVACSGFRYYDYTQVQKLGGSKIEGTFGVGFIFSNNSSTIFAIENGPGFNTYTHSWNNAAWYGQGATPTHYNRVACLWKTGSSYASYVQCRGLVF